MRKAIWDMLSPMGWAAVAGLIVALAGALIFFILPTVHPLVAVIFSLWWAVVFVCWLFLTLFIAGVLR